MPSDNDRTKELNDKYMSGSVHHIPKQDGIVALVSFETGTTPSQINEALAKIPFVTGVQIRHYDILTETPVLYFP